MKVKIKFRNSAKVENLKFDAISKLIYIFEILGTKKPTKGCKLQGEMGKLQNSTQCIQKTEH